MSETKVEIKHMSKIYPNGDGITDIELAIRSGEILTLLRTIRMWQKHPLALSWRLSIH